MQQNLRQKNTYLADVAKGLTLSGVAENSIWNSVKYFHVYENYFTDTLHDCDEGIAKYDMGHILYYFIISNDKFTVDFLNSRMLGFDYSKNGLTNRPPALSYDDIKKKHPPYTGSEMRNFVLTFAMLVSDRIPLDDEVWQFYLVLRKIYDLVYCKKIQKSASDLLSFLVREHNLMYMRLFRDTLKPKHHNAFHYSPFLLRSGPFCHYSSSKFESKHSDSKKSATSTNSRRNILHTLMMKQQLQICYRLIRKEGQTTQLDQGPKQFNGIISDCEEYQYFMNDLLPDFQMCSVISWVNFKGTKYDPGFCVVINSDDLPIFGTISHVLINLNRKISFVLKVLETVNFEENLHAYSINVTNTLLNLPIESLAHPFPVILARIANGNLFVTLKQAL